MKITTLFMFLLLSLTVFSGCSASGEGSTDEDSVVVDVGDDSKGGDDSSGGGDNAVYSGEVRLSDSVIPDGQNSLSKAIGILKSTRFNTKLPTPHRDIEGTDPEKAKRNNTMEVITERVVFSDNAAFDLSLKIPNFENLGGIFVKLWLSNYYFVIPKKFVQKRSDGTYFIRFQGPRAKEAGKQLIDDDGRGQVIVLAFYGDVPEADLRSGTFAGQDDPDNWSSEIYINWSAVPVKTGPVQITLMWDKGTSTSGAICKDLQGDKDFTGSVNLDLWLREPPPYEIEIHRKNQYPSYSGEMDVYDNCGYGPENIVLDEWLEKGEYNVSVKYEYGVTVTVNYTLSVTIDGETQVINGVLHNNAKEAEDIDIFSFEIPEHLF